MTIRLRPLLALLLAIGLSACGKKSDVSKGKTEDPVIPQALKSNQLRGTPSTFLSTHSDSAIHWQTWKPSILEDAEKSQRLIVALIGSARFPGSAETMNALESSPDLVSRLNEDFIPVLVDGEISRDTMLLSAALAAEQGMNIGFPFVVVISPDGAPISWKVMTYANDADTIDQFNSAVEIVSRLWNDSKDYVRSDSLNKLNRRRESPPEPEPSVEDPQERMARFTESIRQLTNLWDESTSSFDTLGGLFPSNLMTLMAHASQAKVLSPAIREKCTDVIRGMSSTILDSAMVDPLDGGIYSARIGPSWNYPMPTRDCITQADAIVSCVNLHSLCEVPNALMIAIKAANFAEESFQTSEGLFSITRAMAAVDPTSIMWNIGDIATNLSDEEFEVWKMTSDLKSLGNLPPEADPSRRSFRKNVLFNSLTSEEIAAQLGISAEEAAQRLESGRMKLVKARENLHPQSAKENTPSALASFQMVSAYCYLYTATGDSQWREKAEKLGSLCRKSFGEARFLNERPGSHPDPMSDSRAYTYSIAARASLDLASVTLDDQWNRWAIDLMTLLAENFANSDGTRLAESREGFEIIPFPFEDRAMIFGPSTAGMVRQNLQSLKNADFPVPPGLTRWLNSLPDLARNPIVYVDTLDALFAEAEAGGLFVGEKVPEEAREAVSRLPIRLFERKIGGTVPGAIKFIAPGGEESILKTASDVQALGGQ